MTLMVSTWQRERDCFAVLEARFGKAAVKRRRLNVVSGTGPSMLLRANIDSSG